MFLLKKMSVIHEAPIKYYLNELCLNDFLGKKIHLAFTGNINCIQCGRKITKTFQQGYCFPCMQKINECNNCMIHPERCLVETHPCDPNDWAHQQCHQQHLVYLANSSGLKVGITRTKNNPSRWIDQGAIQALPIFETQNRYQAGLVEVALKAFVADKTNWRTMLKGDVFEMDLHAEKKRLLAEAKGALSDVLTRYADVIKPLDVSVLAFDYPVLQYPEKIKTHSFDKTPEISGILQGIKGQYLLLDNGVLNIRKFGGYVCIIQ